MGFKLIHHHRTGTKLLRLESELVFMDGTPKVILRWIDLGGVRTPFYAAPLDKARLRQTSADTYQYDGITTDPRFDFNALEAVAASGAAPITKQA